MASTESSPGPRIDVSNYRSEFSRGNRIGRLVWWLTWCLLFRPSPRPLFAWRRFLLRVFGARIGRGANVHASCKIWAPWNLEMGDYSCLAFHVDCYNIEKITLGEHSTVSQYSHLCTASHDVEDPRMGLSSAPIQIGAGAWVAAGAFVGPDVSIGEGGVAAARSVVVRDVEPWTIVAGNPAKKLSPRSLRHE